MYDLLAVSMCSLCYIQLLRHGYFASCRQNSSNVRRSSAALRRVPRVASPVVDTSLLQSQTHRAVEPVTRQDTDDLFPWLNEDHNETGHKSSQPSSTQPPSTRASHQPSPGFLSTNQVHHLTVLSHYLSSLSALMLLITFQVGHLPVNTTEYCTNTKSFSGFPCLLGSPGIFFFKIPGPGKSWKSSIRSWKVLEKYP